MLFKLMLMLSILGMIPRYIAATTFEAEGKAIMGCLEAADKKSLVADWVPTGPTAEDIQAGSEAAAKVEGLLKKRDLGGKLRPAVAKGDLNDIKALIAAGAELDVIDYSGITPLMAAVQKGDIGILKMLISAGANIDAQGSSYGSTALVYAVDKGDIEIAKLLIPKAKDSCNAQVLARAVEKRHAEMVKLLIANGAAKRNKIGFRDFSKEFGGWFLNALRFGDNEVAKALMPLAADEDRLTLQMALSFARSHCSAEVVNAVDDLLKKSNS